MTDSDNPRRIRSPAPSGTDWVEAVAGTHKWESAPPGVRRAWMRMGYYSSRGMSYVWQHRGALLLAHAIGAAITYLTHHIWHWIR